MPSTTYASFVGNVGAVDERLLSKHRALLMLPEHQLHQEALQALRYELDLPADARRRRVIERLRAWLLLETRDARRLAVAFEDVAEQLEPAELQTLRETEEDAVTDGLSYHEFQRLAAFMPSLRKWQKWFPGATRQPGPMPPAFAAAVAMAGTV